MKTIEINGYKAQNFGNNNYSYGMEAIIFNPKDITWQQVAELPNVFLHPTVAPNELEIFALLGTNEQFKDFYKSAIDSHISKQAVSKFGIPDYDDRDAWNKLHKYEGLLHSEFVTWYDRAIELEQASIED